MLSLKLVGEDAPSSPLESDSPTHLYARDSVTYSLLPAPHGHASFVSLYSAYKDTSRGGLGPILTHYGLFLNDYICKDPVSELSPSEVPRVMTSVYFEGR